MKIQPIHIVLGLGALALGYYLIEGASSPPITVATGIMANIKTPPNGKATLQLPAGGVWLAGTRTASASVAPQPVLVPSPATGPWTIPVTAGSNVSVSWQDATGTQQVTFLAFV